MGTKNDDGGTAEVVAAEAAETVAPDSVESEGDTVSLATINDKLDAVLSAVTHSTTVAAEQVSESVEGEPHEEPPPPDDKETIRDSSPVREPWTHRRFKARGN